MQRVFSRLPYTVLALLGSALTFCAVAWVPNIPLAFVFFSDPTLPAERMLALVGQLLVGSITDQSASFLIYTALIAALVGINIALLAFYARAYRQTPLVSKVAGGFAGTVFAVLGFGCASCGALFLSALSAATTGVGLSAVSPYVGVGVGVIGIGLLTTSAALLARAVNKPVVCPI